MYFAMSDLAADLCEVQELETLADMLFFNGHPHTTRTQVNNDMDRFQIKFKK
jgi:hypothetical protein